MRAIDTNLQELVHVERGRLLATSTDKLARTQSIFLYLVICLFDGDIFLRAKGEELLPLLETWTLELCKIRENLGGSARMRDTMIPQHPPPEWEVSAFGLAQAFASVLI